MDYNPGRQHYRGIDAAIVNQEHLDMRKRKGQLKANTAAMERHDDEERKKSRNQCCTRLSRWIYEWKVFFYMKWKYSFLWFNQRNQEIKSLTENVFVQNMKLIRLERQLNILRSQSTSTMTSSSDTTSKQTSTGTTR